MVCVFFVGDFDDCFGVFFFGGDLWDDFVGYFVVGCEDFLGDFFGVVYCVFECVLFGV